MENTTKFHIALDLEDYKALVSLKTSLSEKTGVKLKRADVMRFALRALAKKEKV